MTNGKITRRLALGGLAGAAAAPSVSNEKSLPRSSGQLGEIGRVFVDISLSDAEADTAPGELFELIDSVKGEGSVYRRLQDGSHEIVRRVSSAALEAPGGSGKVGFEDDTVATRLNIVSATMRPAMRGIFSGAADQRAAIIEFVKEAAEGGKTIEWGPVDLSINGAVRSGDKLGIAVPSGSRWVMHPNARFRALPTQSSVYAVFGIRDVKDIIIEGCGARLLGERFDHLGEGGEHGYGVLIKGSSNITVRDLHAEDFWGDGFYVGSTKFQLYSQDILLDSIHGENNRRQGLSLISARGFRCQNSSFRHSNGTAPAAGVDVEPDYPAEFLEDIEFSRILTAENEGAGFKVHLSALDGTSNRIDIIVDQLRERGSHTGIILGGGAKNGIDGLIRFLNPNSRDSQHTALSATNYSVNNPKVILDNPIFEDWNRSNGTAPEYASAVAIHAKKEFSRDLRVGNIHISGARYILNTGSSPRTLAAVDSRENSTTVANVTHANPLEAPPDLPLWVSGLEKIEMSDVNGVIRCTLRPISQVLSPSRFFSYYTVPHLEEQITLDVNNRQAVGAEIEFFLEGGGAGARIRFPAGVKLCPLELGSEQCAASSQLGARLAIKKMAEDAWVVVEMMGHWVVS